MKKPVSAALAAIVLTAALTGCAANSETSGNSSQSSSSSGANDSSSSSSGSSKPESSSSSSSSTPESSSSSSSSTPESSSSSSSSKPESSSSSSSSKPESSSSSSSSTPESSSSSSSNESSSSGAEESDPEIPNAVDRLNFPDNRAGRLAKAGMSEHADQWSGMMNIVSDPADLAIFLPELDVSQCEEYCMVFDMININAHELLIAKPKAGGEDAVKAAFDARFNYIKDPNRFLYPAGMESVEGAVYGTTDDGYLYIVVHRDGKDIEAAINSAK